MKACERVLAIAVFSFSNAGFAACERFAEAGGWNALLPRLVGPKARDDFVASRRCRRSFPLCSDQKRVDRIHSLRHPKQKETQKRAASSQSCAAGTQSIQIFVEFVLGAK